MGRKLNSTRLDGSGIVAVDPAKLLSTGVKGLARKPLEPGELRAVIADYLQRDCPPRRL